MRLFLIGVLFLVGSLPSFAYTCQDVREFIRSNDKLTVAWVRSRMTPEQLAQAERCLRPKKRPRIRKGVN